MFHISFKALGIKEKKDSSALYEKNRNFYNRVRDIERCFELFKIIEIEGCKTKKQWRVSTNLRSLTSEDLDQAIADKTAKHQKLERRLEQVYDLFNQAISVYQFEQF